MKKVELFIDGHWRTGKDATYLPVVDPASEAQIGHFAVASEEDVDQSIAAAAKAFSSWRSRPALERYKILRRAADDLRKRVDDIAPDLTLEQGKPLGEAKMEVAAAADIIDWLAEEGRRAYGRIIPSRAQNVRQLVIKEPVGPVAAFSPWNFPIGQAARKLAAALATGCTIVLKGPEETPVSCAHLVRAFESAGVPAGVVNLVFGDPASISAQMIPDPRIRKVTFTGSTQVGKALAEMAGRHMKRTTMELGGHAPVIICSDADIDAAVEALGAAKFRNAGQICASPTRFMVHESRYDEFVSKFVERTKSITLGGGLTPGVTMGPLANERRLAAMQALVENAIENGAEVAVGGSREGIQGYFYQPTILLNCSSSALVMNEEPFGPVAPVKAFKEYEEAIHEANRLPYGLGAFAFTNSELTARQLSRDIEAGMVSINHVGLAMPETPFGGVKDSGYGSEGGCEAIEPYLTPKFITHAALA